MNYKKPQLHEKTFTCPHCHVLAQHEWMDIAFMYDDSTYYKDAYTSCSDTMIAMCLACQGKTLWYKEELLYPSESAPEPNPDMPPDVLSLYKEAGEIYCKSPRAACALLRLAVEHLCNNIVGKEDTIDKNIARLVKDGLPEKIQQALDIVRVIGNKAIHPAQIALDIDNINTARTLFDLLNIITSNMITEKNRIKEVFSILPESTKKAIDKRDK